jgi:hypothetical protein
MGLNRKTVGSMSNENLNVNNGHLVLAANYTYCPFRAAKAIGCVGQQANVDVARVGLSGS